MSDSIKKYEEITAEKAARRIDLIAQNGNDGLHYETPAHYNNSNGSLYKVALMRGWNPYLFDIVKRLERSEKKGEFLTDLDKSKGVIDLWKKEHSKNYKLINK